MSKKSYAEKLKDPRWQRKRLEVLSIADWTCETCGSSEDHLHVHHKFYLKNKDPWDYDITQLAVLCEVCHEIAEEDQQRLLHFLSSANLCDIKTITGYSYALSAFSCGYGGAFNLECDEEAQGVADYFGVRWADLSKAFRMDNGTYSFTASDAIALLGL